MSNPGILSYRKALLSLRSKINAHVKIIHDISYASLRRIILFLSYRTIVIIGLNKDSYIFYLVQANYTYYNMRETTLKTHKSVHFFGLLIRFQFDFYILHYSKLSTLSERYIFINTIFFYYYLLEWINILIKKDLRLYNG